MAPSLAFPDRSLDTVVYNQPDPRPSSSVFRVTGYLPLYSVNRIQPESLAFLTDLVFFAAEPGYGGEVVTPRVIPAHWNKLQRAGRDYGVRLHLGVKDLSDLPEGRGLAQIAQNSKSRKVFAQSLRDVVISRGFIGADIDWEYPRGESIKDFTLLLRELRTEFEPYGLELSIAASPYVPLEKEAYILADQVHLMSYDDKGAHSSMTQTRQHLLFTLKRVQPNRLLLGLPFYGRASGGVGWSKSKSYKDILQEFGPSSDMDSISGYFFNGLDTIQNKTRLARRMGLGGVMIWELGQDAHGQDSLLAAIHQTALEFYPFVALRQREPEYFLFRE